MRDKSEQNSINKHYRKLLLTNRQLERKTASLSALYDISSALNSIIDLDELLKFILQKTKELLDVEGASIILCDQDKNELYFPTVAVEQEETEKRLKRLRFPVDSGIAGWVFCEEKAALVQNVSVDERFYREIDDNTEFITKSILCVPLCSKESMLGVIEVVNKKEEEFTKDDQSILEAIADDVAVSIERANLYQDLQRAEALLRRQNAELRKAIKQKYRFENIIGNSDKMINVLKKAEQVALTNAIVLIYGETGTGKELVAQAIHHISPRAQKKFVPINCGAIPENLLESELFGHEKGAFTSAIRRRIGRFEEASGGTLFLDEIGDMPKNLQVKLLRVLEEDVIQRLGSNQNISVDVRIIAATHQDLEQLVAEEKFRQDLYFRLKVFELELPPLRERREDIPLLINHFIRHYNEKLGKQIDGIDDKAEDILCDFDYPGNVRQLQNIIESAMVLCKRNLISIDVLPKEIQVLTKPDKKLIANERDLVIPKNNEELKAQKAKARQEAEAHVERLFLEELLSSTKGNVSEAARQAGMNRSWLSQLISKHQLEKSQFREGVSN